MNFLEHEVLEAALFRLDRVPGHALHLPRNRISIKVCQLHAVRRDDRHVTVSEKENVPSVMQDGGDIRGDKVLAIAQTNHRRRTVARSDDLVGVIDLRSPPGQRLHSTA